MATLFDVLFLLALFVPAITLVSTVIVVAFTPRRPPVAPIVHTRRHAA